MPYKKIIFVISFLAVFGFIFNFGIPGVKAQANALTESQIQAVLNLLRAFQVDPSIISNVESALRGVPPTEEKPTPWCHNFTVKLRIGDTDESVKALQIALQKEGLLSTEQPTYKFDERTASAVVAFQEKYKEDILAPWGLEHGTGYVGRTTLAKLNELYGCEVIPPVRKSITVISPNGGEEWKIGETYTVKWQSKGIKEVNILLVDYRAPETCYLNTEIECKGEEALCKPVPVPAGLGKYTFKLENVICFPGMNQHLLEKIKPGDRYKVKIEDAGYPTISDFSDNYFSSV